MRAMPERPARIDAQASATPMPTGDTMPRPVTTTRRRAVIEGWEWNAGNEHGAGRPASDRWGPRRRGLLLVVRLDVVDRLLHRGDLLRFLVGDFGFEFLLERHHELHRVERVGAEILDERRFVLDLGVVHSELLGHDLLDPLLYVFHASPPLRGRNYKTEGLYRSQ